MTYDVAPLPGFEPQIGLLLASLDDSTREWRENLEKPPIDAIMWQIAPNGPSIGALLLHLIDCEVGWIEQFCGGKPADPEQDALLMTKEVDQMHGTWPTPHEQPIEWYFDLHDQIRERCKVALRTMSDPGQVFEGGTNRYSLRWVLAHVIEHDSYTGGQAVLLHETWKRQR